LLIPTVVTLVAACSGGSASPSAATPTGAAPTSAATVQASASATGDGSLARVQQAGTLKVCAVDGLLPYSASDATTPGFEVEIARAIAAKLNVKVEHAWGTFDGLISMLTSKQCDAIVDGLFITDERKKTIDYAGAEYASGEAILVPKTDTTTHGLADLKDKNVGVLSGSVTVDLLKKAGFGDNLKIYPDQNTIILELNNGRIAAGFLEAPSAAWALKQDESLNIKLVADYVPDERFDAGVAIRKEDKDLGKAIGDALAQMRSDGTIAGILGKYGVPFYPVK
jgi:ABC-type amino acid transport substrate-binding protein